MSDLKRVVEMGRLLAKQQEREAELEAELKATKKERLRIEREDLPELMTEIGMSEFKLDNGFTIVIEEDCDARITDKTRPAALKWLLENGFGGLIKTEVTLPFNRGEHEKALEVSGELSKDYPDVSLKEGVHHSTLKAFVKEQMAAGAAIPMDLFNVHPYAKATLKRK